MPEPTIDSVAPGGIVQLNNPPAPLDDATFDSLFPAESTPQTAPAQQGQPQQPVPATQTPQTTAPQTPPQAEPQEQYFLRGAKSVYKTSEAAVEGLNNKDALIEQLRQRYALTTGVDPITGQPVGQMPAIQQPVDDYSTNPTKYMNDLIESAKSGKPEAYTAVQQKFIRDSLKDYLPALQHTAVEQARTKVSSEIPTFNQFLTSPIYSKALDSNPELKEAIALGESDSRFSSRLPGLYKLAHQVADGMQLRETLKAQTQIAAPQTSPQQQQVVRTTTAPTTQSVPVQTARPSFRTNDGLKAIIADAEARGVKLEF